MFFHDLAMVVVSCDAYTELGTVFFDLQEQNMGWYDGPRFFVNESKPVGFRGVQVIHVGTDVDWSGKMQRAMSRISEKYILFMLEDYFIGKEVQQEKLTEAMQIIRDHNLRYYKITAIPKIRKQSNLADYLSPIPSNIRYGINLQAAIFERSFLQEIIEGPDRSAWKTETDLLKKVTSKYEYDIPGCVVDNRNIIDIHNGVIKGKWVPDTIEYFQKKGYMIDLGERPMLSKKEIVREKLLSQLSHILPTGAVKRIKRCLIGLGFKFVSEN